MKAGGNDVCSITHYTPSSFVVGTGPGDEPAMAAFSFPQTRHARLASCNMTSLSPEIIISIAAKVFCHDVHDTSKVGTVSC